jgi:hypothetical protein
MIDDKQLNFMINGSLPGWTWQNRPSQEETYAITCELRALRELRRQILESDRSCDPDTGEETTLDRMQHLAQTMSLTAWPPWNAKLLKGED